MPMIRDTPPPLPADVLRELRASLAPSYGHRLVDHEGRLVLAVRVPAEVPDRERDLARAADVVAEDLVQLARDVLLIGAERLVRLDPIPLRDAVREKLRDDLPASKEARRALAREHGAALFQPATRPRDVCLAVRVPRASYRDTTPEDLAALQAAVQPLLAKPEAARVGLCYLVADQDYRRCPPEEFARVLRGESPLRPPRVNTYAVAGDGRAARAMPSMAGLSGSPFGMLVSSAAAMETKMQKAKAAKPGTPPAAPAAAAPAAPAPALEPAAPPPAPPAPPTPAQALVALSSQLHALGFEVLADVQDLGLALAAHQPGGKRLVVQAAPRATVEAVQALAARCKELEADAGVLLAEAVAPEAVLAAAGGPVAVLPAAVAATWNG